MIVLRVQAVLMQIKCAAFTAHIHAVLFPKERQLTRHASFLRYPSRSRNKLCLWSDAQNTSDFFDLEACPASLIGRSFVNTTVRPVCADNVLCPVHKMMSNRGRCPSQVRYVYDILRSSHHGLVPAEVSSSDICKCICMEALMNSNDRKQPFSASPDRAELFIKPATRPGNSDNSPVVNARYSLTK
jgi:hypothetical protein